MVGRLATLQRTRLRGCARCCSLHLATRNGDATVQPEPSKWMTYKFTLARSVRDRGRFVEKCSFAVRLWCVAKLLFPQFLATCGRFWVSVRDCLLATVNYFLLVVTSLLTMVEGSRDCDASTTINCLIDKYTLIDCPSSSSAPSIN